jgi:hypothetical protein
MLFLQVKQISETDLLATTALLRMVMVAAVSRMRMLLLRLLYFLSAFWLILLLALF